MFGYLATLLPATLSSTSFDNAIDLTKMLVEVGVFAALIYTGLRFLRETRGSGVIYGMTLVLVATIAFWILIETFQLAALKEAFNAVAQSVVIGLVVVFHPEIRKAILHLGDSPIFNRFFRHDSRIVPRLVRARGGGGVARDDAPEGVAVEGRARARDPVEGEHGRRGCERRVDCGGVVHS